MCEGAQHGTYIHKSTRTSESLGNIVSSSWVWHVGMAEWLAVKLTGWGIAKALSWTLGLAVDDIQSRASDIVANGYM